MSRKLSISSIDVTIGKRICNERIMSGLSRIELADKLGVSHQQISKYEKGLNSISASGLVKISKILEKNISYFYKDIDFEESEYKRMICEVSKKFQSLDIKYKNLINNLINGLM